MSGSKPQSSKPSSTIIERGVQPKGGGVTGSTQPTGAGGSNTTSGGNNGGSK